MGLAVIMVGQYLSLLIGSLVRGLGWVTAGYTLISVCLPGFLSAWLARVR